MDIVIAPNKILKKKMPEVEENEFSSQELRKIIKEMKETMEKNNGAGLAANQVGIEKSFFIASWEDKFYAIFNPKITKHSKEIIEIEEGCLSLPGITAIVPRYSSISVKAQKITGKKIKLNLFGMLAIIFQHEIDHLNGVLMTDKAKKIEKKKD